MGQKKKDSNSGTDFSVVVDELKKIQKLRRKKRSSKSKLDKHSSVIKNLCDADASLMQIVIYLQREKRCKISRSALHRWLKSNDLTTTNQAPIHSRKEAENA